MLLSVSFLAVSPHRQGAMESNKVGPRDKVNKKKIRTKTYRSARKHIESKVEERKESTHIIREKSRLKVKLYLMSWTD